MNRYINAAFKLSILTAVTGLGLALTLWGFGMSMDDAFRAGFGVSLIAWTLVFLAASVSVHGWK